MVMPPLLMPTLPLNRELVRGVDIYETVSLDGRNVGYSLSPSIPLAKVATLAFWL